LDFWFQTYFRTFAWLIMSFILQKPLLRESLLACCLFRRDQNLYNNAHPEKTGFLQRMRGRADWRDCMMPDSA
jgi:hypothetical protein